MIRDPFGYYGYPYYNEEAFYEPLTSMDGKKKPMDYNKFYNLQNRQEDSSAMSRYWWKDKLMNAENQKEFNDVIDEFNDMAKKSSHVMRPIGYTTIPRPDGKGAARLPIYKENSGFVYDTHYPVKGGLQTIIDQTGSYLDGIRPTWVDQSLKYAQDKYRVLLNKFNKINEGITIGAGGSNRAIPRPPVTRNNILDLVGVPGPPAPSRPTSTMTRSPRTVTESPKPKAKSNAKAQTPKQNVAQNKGTATQMSPTIAEQVPIYTPPLGDLEYDVSGYGDYRDVLKEYGGNPFDGGYGIRTLGANYDIYRPNLNRFRTAMPANEFYRIYGR